MRPHLREAGPSGVVGHLSPASSPAQPAALADRGTLDVALLDGPALARLSDLLREGVVLMTDGRITAANAAAARILGAPARALVGRTSLSSRWGVVDVTGAPLPDAARPEFRAWYEGRAARDVTLGICRPDGARAWLRVNAVLLPLDGTGPRAALGPWGGRTVALTFEDVTVERESARAAREHEHRFAVLAHRAPVAIVEIDAAGECSFANARFAALTGVAEAAALGDGWLAAFAAEEREALLNAWAAAVEDGRPLRRQLRLAAADGEAARVAVLTLDPVLDAPHAAGTFPAALRGFVGALEDVTAEAAAADRWRAAASHDALTGLLNRGGFLAAARARLAADADVVADDWWTLLYLDLDHFKAINDTWGHAVGDRALTRMADVLRGVVRAGSDLVARLGGDEFVVCTRVPDAACADRLVARLHEAVAAANADAGDAPFRLAVSVGVARCPTDGAPPIEALLADADDALLARKRARRAGSVRA